MPGEKGTDSRVPREVAGLLAKFKRYGMLGHQQKYDIRLYERSNNGKVVCKVSSAARLRKRC
jgi:hypothetical protein